MMLINWLATMVFETTLHTTRQESEHKEYKKPTRFKNIVTMTNGSMIQGTARSKCTVQSDVHFTAEAWRLLALNTLKYYANCGQWQ